MILFKVNKYEVKMRVKFKMRPKDQDRMKGRKIKENLESESQSEF